MQITLDAKKNINENAAVYFEKAKKAREKKAALAKAIAEVERKIAEAERKIASEKQAKQGGEKTVAKSLRKKAWFERFHAFRTSGGRLCIAGKDASQNELLVKHYFEENDLFFHADVQGAAATVLKDGVNAGTEEKREAAQWAACYSKAWKAGYATCDVYAVGRPQVSKTPKPGEYLPKGAFVIRGQREWFKNTELKLEVGFVERALVVVPNSLGKTLEKRTEIEPAEKKVLAQELTKKLWLGPDGRERLLQLLP